MNVWGFTCVPSKEMTTMKRLDSFARALDSKGFFFAALSVIFVVSILVPTTWLEPHVPTLCPSRALFNISCSTCGMTRAFSSIGHGQFRQAWDYNRLSFLVFGVLFWLWFRLGLALLRPVSARL